MVHQNAADVNESDHENNKSALKRYSNKCENKVWQRKHENTFFCE